MVTFGDAKEMRQALVEMDKHMVSSEMASSEAGMASLVQHVLYVKLAEVRHVFCVTLVDMSRTVVRRGESRAQCDLSREAVPRLDRARN